MQTTDFYKAILEDGSFIIYDINYEIAEQIEDGLVFCKQLRKRKQKWLRIREIVEATKEEEELVCSEYDDIEITTKTYYPTEPFHLGTDDLVLLPESLVKDYKAKEEFVYTVETSLGNRDNTFISVFDFGFTFGIDSFGYDRFSDLIDVFNKYYGYGVLYYYTSFDFTIVRSHVLDELKRIDFEFNKYRKLKKILNSIK